MYECDRILLPRRSWFPNPGWPGSGNQDLLVSGRAPGAQARSATVAAYRGGRASAPSSVGGAYRALILAYPARRVRAMATKPALSVARMSNAQMMMTVLGESPPLSLGGVAFVGADVVVGVADGS